MKIDSLKEFKALVKACRQLGVDAVEVDGLKIALGREPIKASNPAIDKTSFPEESIAVPRFNGPIEAPQAPDTSELTEEQLLMWSAEGHEEHAQ